ncbi:tetratricopeptide repeat protein [bacterium BMS3Abin04]|nr:tetratricopeptide repeat protein [bacterium BMS3Abin04]
MNKCNKNNTNGLNLASRTWIISTLLMIFIFGLIDMTFAQSTRSLINKGVDLYEKKKYSDSEVDFKKGIENDAESFEGYFNLGDALYKQGRYNEALEALKKSYSLAKTDRQKENVYYNVGNTLLKAKKYAESIDAYKNALKINPKDLDAKYNLSYALQMMKNQKNKNKNNKNKNKNNKNNKDKNQQNKQDRNKKDKQKQKQNQKNDKKKNDQQKQKQQSQPKKDEISKSEANRILDALKNNEAEIQKQIRKRKGKVRKTDKDW